MIRNLTLLVLLLLATASPALAETMTIERLPDGWFKVNGDQLKDVEIVQVPGGMIRLDLVPPGPPGPVSVPIIKSGEWQNPVPGALGCFRDAGNPRGTKGRVLDGLFQDVAGLTPDRCIAICREANFAYAGVQVGTQCFCGSGAYDRLGPAACGEDWSNTVYATGADRTDGRKQVRLKLLAAARSGMIRYRSHGFWRNLTVGDTVTIEAGACILVSSGGRAELLYLNSADRVRLSGGQSLSLLGPDPETAPPADCVDGGPDDNTMLGDSPR